MAAPGLAFKRKHTWIYLWVQYKPTRRAGRAQDESQGTCRAAVWGGVCQSPAGRLNLTCEWAELGEAPPRLAGARGCKLLPCHPQGLEDLCAAAAAPSEGGGFGFFRCNCGIFGKEPIGLWGVGGWERCSLLSAPSAGQGWQLPKAPVSPSCRQAVSRAHVWAAPCLGMGAASATCAIVLLAFSFLSVEHIPQGLASTLGQLIGHPLHECNLEGKYFMCHKCPLHWACNCCSLGWRRLSLWEVWDSHTPPCALTTQGWRAGKV